MLTGGGKGSLNISKDWGQDKVDGGRGKGPGCVGGCLGV